MIEQRDVLLGVEIEPEKAVLRVPAREIADILRPILPAGCCVRGRRAIAPVVFDETSASPEVSLVVYSWCGLRTELQTPLRRTRDEWPGPTFTAR